MEEQHQKISRQNSLQSGWNSGAKLGNELTGVCTGKKFIRFQYPTVPSQFQIVCGELSTSYQT